MPPVAPRATAREKHQLFAYDADKSVGAADFSLRNNLAGSGHKIMGLTTGAGRSDSG